jgi:hypothetical protein
MALTRLTNLIASRNGRMIYVNPDDFNASDLISNNGNSPTRPFKTIQRALLEVARFSYVSGQNNDKYDQFTINLAPGDYIIDNRPGTATSAEVPELSDQSNFDILDPNNDLYKFNAASTIGRDKDGNTVTLCQGGLVIPRGTSIVGMDLRKTRVRPRYVPDPTESAGLPKTTIFKVTGACYFWQFSLFDALQKNDSSGLGGVYSGPTNTATVNADYSHHKVTCFTYADQTDLDLFYQKASRAFASIPETSGELSSRTQENRIVGPLQQSGEKPINSINVVGSVITITTTGNHEVFEGQQITLANISGSYIGLNGTYYVSKVNSTTQFTITAAGFTAGNVPSGNITSAVVRAEIDTVDSSSPYIFNCSLRSTYGLCGLWADGQLVTGFKSMVVAQFTGVSLQKDDRAFIKFSELTSPNPSFVQEGGAANAVSLHQDSTGYIFYKENWRNYHIRVSNNAFIQSVSVFAVGYAEQHLIESGGDYSITNSNSNFGTQALIADGFRPDSFELDKKGYISHIVPPQSLETLETEVPYYPIDVQKSRIGVISDGVGSELYLYEQTDPNSTPAFDINQYKIGGRISDKLYVNLTNPVNGAIQEYEAVINPNGIESHNITSVDVANNLFTTQLTNSFETATPIRIYSSTGYLPLGMESNKLYYAIKITNTSFKIAASIDDARAGAGGAVNSIVNIRSNIPSGASLVVKAFVSDTDPELPRFDISVNATLDTFSTGTYNHGFTTGDKVFFKRRIVNGITSSGALPLVQINAVQQSLSLTTEFYVIKIDTNTFKIADSESNANNGIAIPVDTNGDPNTIKVYRNIQKSPLRYNPARSNWYISVKADSTNKIHSILTSSNSNSIYQNPSLTNTENSYIKRVSDDRSNPDRTYRLRYVLSKTELNTRPPLLGYVIRRKTDANNAIIPYNTATQSGQTSEFDRIYFIYKVDTILTHIPGEQDGVYYLTVLLADISPSGSQFNSVSNEFGFLKYSQDVSKIYPDLDKDNPSADPAAAISVADNLIHGYVYQDNDRSSITKESVQAFATDTGFTPSLGSSFGKSVSGQENRLIAFDGTVASIQVELRRTSQIRAGNQTFEYTGFNSGNYSTGFPSKQQRVLTDKEVLYSQAQRRRAGVVFYSGLNAYGDLYVGNQKINAVTGEVEILDKPILKVAGSAAASNSEFVPYISGTKNVNIEGTLVTGGGANKTANAFNNESYFNEGIKVSTKEPDSVNRALITHDVVYRPKEISVDTNFLNGNVKQTVLSLSTLSPTPGVEGTYKGDVYYKGTIDTTTRHEGYIYVGPKPDTSLLNGGWAQIGLVGVGHLTSIEDSYTQTGTLLTPEPYTVTGRFGINKVNPTGALHVGTGNVVFDNDLEVSGGDITSSAANFNLLNQSTTVNAFASGTNVNIGSTSGTTTLRNANVVLTGDLAVNGGDITTTAVNFNLLNQPTGNVVAFNSADRLWIGSASRAVSIGATDGIGTTTINHRLAIAGDLIVAGKIATVESETVTVRDPVITLGGSYISTLSGVTTTSGVATISGMPPSQGGVAVPSGIGGVYPNDPKDRGVELRYWDTTVKTGFMGWDTSAQKYTLLKNATNLNDVFSGTEAELQIGKITVTDTTNAFNYNVNPFSNFTNGGYSAASDTNVNVNFRRLIEKYATPVGAIIMWAGSTTNIPDGWTLCDGSTKKDRDGNSVTIPDLRDRFIVGAGSTYSPNATGGQVSQTINQNTGDNNQTPSVSGTSGGTRLIRNQIPPHRHGLNHGHTVVQTPHGHTATDSGHSHQLSRHSGNQNVNNQSDRYALATSNNLGKDSTESASAVITVAPASANVTIPAGNVIDSNYYVAGVGAWSGPAIGRDPGVNNDCGEYDDPNAPAAEHSHSLSITISNTTHQHNMNFTINTLPPYYALAYIYKL